MEGASKTTEKARVKNSAPATTDSSKAEGSKEVTSTADGAKTDQSSEIQGLKEVIKERDETIRAKDAEIQQLQAQIESLKSEASKKRGKGAKDSKRFVVVNSFRGNTKADNGKIYDINEDVSHFDADRLKNLVERELVKEV